MRHLYRSAREEILRAAAEAAAAGLFSFPDAFTAKVTAEPPREASHGDISTNIAMLLAKENACAPRALAEKFLPALSENPLFATAEIAGPGFINLRFADNALYDAFAALLALKEEYAPRDCVSGRVNVEYVSANPTGPMHIGHARGAVFGDALSALLERAGAEVTREYYINDAGAQIDTVARSVEHRYRELLGEETGPVPEGCYPGAYVIDIARTLREAEGDNLMSLPEEERLALLKRFAVDTVMEMIRGDLAELGIKHDVFTSEKALADSGAVAKTTALLQEKGLLYEGVLEAPKGKTPEDWEPRPQTLFKSTEFGDDQDRALVKSDGTHTYFAGDAAYHADKIARGFNALHIVLGADHGGYVKRLSAVTSALSGGTVPITAHIAQIVRFFVGGEPLKMSKRAGVFVTVHDVVKELGGDAVRFIMLTRKNDAPLDFDIDLAREQSKDNPVFYVQYAYARACSVMRQAAESAPEALQASNTAAAAEGYAFSPSEKQLQKTLLEWPRALEQAATAAEPHRIADYARKCAQLFHSLWAEGSANAELRFIIQEKPKDTAARLALLNAFLYTMASALGVLGVNAPEEM